MTKWLDWEDLDASLISGRRVFVPGSSGEPTAFLEAMKGRPEVFSGSEVVTSFMAGVNSFDLFSLSQTNSVTSFFPLNGAETSANERVRLVPLSYFEIDGFLSRCGLDVAIAQVSPPDAAGRCSLGPCVEFNLTALGSARIRIAIVNPRVPFVPGSRSVDLATFDFALHADAPLHGLASPAQDPVSTMIADNVCTLIEDDATLQTGIGKIPGLVLARLGSHRGLRVHSGIITPAIRDLANAGVIKGAGSILAGSAIGDADFYNWLASDERVRITEIRETHDLRTIVSTPKFIAINSAIEVDLFGQCNCEVAGGKRVSAAGGLPDFTTAARRSVGGRSIIALPSADAKGRYSRIVARLDASAPVSIPRFSVDFVVTEYGVADLRDKTSEERAAALIAIAAPKFREDLGAL